MKKYDVYFGSIGSRGGTFVPSYEFNESDGSLTYKGKTDGLFNPSYTNFDHDYKLFFSVSKDRKTDKGFVYSWKVDGDQLIPAGRFHTGGDGPCYVMVDRTNTFVSAANYPSGSFKIWKFDSEGKLTPYGMAKRHRGSSIDPKRQTHPYCHSTVWSPWHDIVYVCDLGTDRVVWYKNNEKKQVFDKEGQVDILPGSGPRHLTFHPNMQVAYLLNEIGNAVTSFKVLNNGALIEMQHVSTVPDDFTEFSSGADIHVSPDGKFVYASNRGHDSLAIFKTDQHGQVTLIGFAPTLGKSPRGFDISPSGDWIICGNQDSMNVVVFRRDKKTGMLEPVHKYEDTGAGLVNVRFKLK